ncbi:MAG: iron ABC transporter permease [Pseudomonadota bacterium]
MSAAAHSSWRPAEGFSFKWAIVLPCVVLVAFLALVPLAFLLWQSFLTPGSGRIAGTFTLDNYAAAYGGSNTLRLLVNSLVFASGTALLAFVLGGSLAWMNERTNTPFKTLFFSLSIVPLVIPGIMFTIAWILIGSPKIGILNALLQGIFSTDRVFFDVYSMAGMIWVDGLHYSPVAFLMMTAAFRSMDPSLEESALMSGASVWQIARDITFKLTWPAVFATLLILFIRAIESFEVPALLGLPVGLHVFTSAIYQAIHQYPSQTGLASAYATVLLLIAAAGIYFQSRISRHGRRYATVTGKGFRPRTIDLGKWKYLTLAVFLCYFALVVVLPFLVLLWSSFQSFYSVPSMDALKNMSFDSYRFILKYPNFSSAVWNSVMLALVSATIVMLLTSVICWIVIRTRAPGRELLDQIASVPLVVPGIVLGLALMIFFLNYGVGVYGTIWILLIAYVARFMPYGMRYNTTSMLQIHKELEESAEMTGASWIKTFWHILLPLLKPGLLAGWLFVVIVSMRELSSSILLYSPGNEVLSIVVWELWEAGQFVELSALGVLFIGALFILTMAAQLLSKRFGIKET